MERKDWEIWGKGGSRGRRRLGGANNRGIGSNLACPLAIEKPQSRKSRRDVISKRRGGKNQDEKTPARKNKTKNHERRQAHFIPRASRSCPASRAVGKSPTGSSSRFLTRYSKPPH